MATKDWIRKRTKEPFWTNIKTGKALAIFFMPKELFYSMKHPVGKYDVFIYNKARTTRQIPFKNGTKTAALKFAKQYMRKH